MVEVDSCAFQGPPRGAAPGEEAGPELGAGTPGGREEVGERSGKVA